MRSCRAAKLSHEHMCGGEGPPPLCDGILRECRRSWGGGGVMASIGYQKPAFHVKLSWTPLCATDSPGTPSELGGEVYYPPCCDAAEAVATFQRWKVGNASLSKRQKFFLSCLHSSMLIEWFYSHRFLIGRVQLHRIPGVPCTAQSQTFCPLLANVN